MSVLDLECFGGPCDGRVIEDFAGSAYMVIVLSETGHRFAFYRLWRLGERPGLYFTEMT